MTAAFFAAGFDSFAAPADSEDGTEEVLSEEPDSEANAVEGGAFEVTEMEIRAVVNKDHSYDVEETISINIPDTITGAEFVLPSGRFRLSNAEAEGIAYSLKTSVDSNSISITDPEALKKGRQVYTVKYRIQEYVERDSSKDIFYFSILPPEWRQPIGKLNIEVKFPEDFPWNDMQCYAGQFGVQDATNKITFKANKAKRSVSVKGNLLPENFGISLKAQLEDGYWEDALSGEWTVLASVISMAGVLLILLAFWFAGGRDPRVVKEDGINGPLDDLPAPELEYALNQRMSIRSILLLIIQFASRGYLRISEYEPKRYKLYRLQKPISEERAYRRAYDILFEEVYRGRALEMDELVRRLDLMRQSLEDDVAARYPGSESLAFTPLSKVLRIASALVLAAGTALAMVFSYMYDYKPVNYTEAMITGLAVGLTAIIVCMAIDRLSSSSANSAMLLSLISGLLFAMPVFYAAYRMFANTKNFILPLFMVLAAALSGFLIYIMRARGSENAARVSRIRKLRNFINHPTPKELLENHLVDEDYYYDMLIYALAFGAEESWAISFLTLEVEEPDWYTDDIQGHTLSNLKENRTTIDYARDLRSFMRTTENAYNLRNENT